MTLENFLALICSIFFLYLVSYVKEKSKNLATKEDIEEITNKIEFVRATINSRLSMSQVRYQKEFEILSQLSSAAVDLKDAANLVSPDIDVAPADSNDTKDEKQRRKVKYSNALGAYYNVIEKQRPFYPEEIYTLAFKIGKLSWSQVIVSDPSVRFSPEQIDWDKIKSQAKQLDELTRELIDKIRTRIREWEKFQ